MLTNFNMIPARFKKTAPNPPKPKTHRAKPVIVNWTAEELDILRSMMLDGATTRDVIARLIEAGYPERSRNSILGAKHRLGILTGGHGGQRTPRTVTRIEPASVARATTAKEAAAPRVGRIRFIDRGMFQCAYITDEKTHILDRMVCGDPVVKGKSWCASCSRIVWGNGTPSERDAIRSAERIVGLREARP